MKTLRVTLTNGSFTLYDSESYVWAFTNHGLRVTTEDERLMFAYPYTSILEMREEALDEGDS